MANTDLAAAFGAADCAKEQDLRGYYPMAARMLADGLREARHAAAKHAAQADARIAELEAALEDAASQLEQEGYVAAASEARAALGPKA